MQRLDRGNLHSSQRPQFFLVAGPDDSVPHVTIVQFQARQVDDLAAMSDDQDALLFGDGLCNDCRHDHCLPGGRRRDQEELFLSRCDRAVEFSDNVCLVRAKHRRGHGAPPATMSSAQPSGVDARPEGPRSSACRMTSSGTPCCKASEQTTAESLAIESEVLPGRPFPMKISARRLSGKNEMVAT